MNKGDLLWKFLLKFRWEHFVKKFLCLLHGFIDLGDLLLEEFDVSVTLGDYLLPVPLINMDRMDWRYLLILSDCEHVSDEAFSFGEIVLS